jgi:hypothetical protein
VRIVLSILSRKDNDQTAYIWFRRAQLELNETDLGFLDPSRASGARNDVLVENETVHKLSVVDGPADLFHNSDVAQVDVGRSRSDQAFDSIDCNGSQDGRIL